MNQLQGNLYLNNINKYKMLQKHTQKLPVKRPIIFHPDYLYTKIGC